MERIKGIYGVFHVRKTSLSK